jgi:hypothetical protein
MKNIQRHGMFITTGDPSPLMQKVMEDIQRQHQAEAAQRKAIRECRESTSDFPSWGPAMGQWGHWNISDRD